MVFFLANPPHLPELGTGLEQDWLVLPLGWLVLPLTLGWMSPLLFITVLEEAAKECRGEGPWEQLYTDDLVLTAESREGVTDKFNGWKAGIEKRGLKINMDKAMVMVTGKEAREKIQSGDGRVESVVRWARSWLTRCSVWNVTDGLTRGAQD
jgi:hypothetical protein